MSHVTVHYFAAARELCGCAQEQLPLPAAAASTTAADILAQVGKRHPPIAPLLQRMRVAVNGAFADPKTVVHPGDEISVLPPVAGGAPPAGQRAGLTAVRLAEIREQPITVDASLAAVSHPGAGGVDLFIGIVRDHADGEPVSRLDYEAHPTMAQPELAAVLAEVAAALPGTRLAAQHRVGSLQVGDIAVVVAASAPHRDAAFRACRQAIDTLKQRVPIWKKEWAPDGAAHWVNLKADPDPT